MPIKSLVVPALAFLACAAAAAASDDFRLEKQLDLASGGSFSLRSEAGGVEVRGADAERATVVVTSDRQDFAEIFNVRFDSQPNHVAVVIERKVRGPLSWFGGFRGRVHVDVTLPRRVETDIESSGGSLEIADLEGRVKADSSGGGVRIADVTGDVTLSSSGGSVKVERVHGAVRAESSGGGVSVSAVDGTAHLESSGGSIVVDSVSGDLRASTSGGGVRVENAGGAVVADSSGGPVRVGFAAGNAKGGSLDSSGGGVEARVDPAVGLEIDASSSGGSVSSDLPITIRGKVSRDSLRGNLNGGGALLKLRSSGGGIDLKPR